MAAREVSGSGSVVMICGVSSETGPWAESVTSCQMPMSRSRMAGIQSQPSVSAKVGPSMAMRPPFSPGPSASDCSCGMPGWSGGEMRTARTLSPGVRRLATSKRPRLKAPSMRPSAWPLSHTCAR